MPDIRELYQEVILEHSRSPRNYKRLEPADRTAEGDNPLCGDQCTVYLNMDGETIRDVGFEGQGCAISKSSASLMTTQIKGKTITEVEGMFEAFHEVVTGKRAADESLGKLAVFAGVRDYPSRVKCASLAWHTLHAALKDQRTPVRTEDA